MKNQAGLLNIQYTIEINSLDDINSKMNITQDQVKKLFQKTLRMSKRWKNIQINEARHRKDSIYIIRVPAGEKKLMKGRWYMKKTSENLQRKTDIGRVYGDIEKRVDIENMNT